MRQKGIGRPRASRAEAIARITRLLEKDEAATLQMTDLCKAGGVSERTLRAIFVEEFGVSPKQYLRARKLHAVRAALAVASSSDTVSRIAGSFGVSDVGRMAKSYYALFGEYPHETLKRSVTSCSLPDPDHDKTSG